MWHILKYALTYMKESMEGRMEGETPIPPHSEINILQSRCAINK